MSQQAESAITRWQPMMIVVGLGMIITGMLLVGAEHVLGALQFTVFGLLEVAPLVVPGILLAAWIIARGANAKVALAFDRRTVTSVIAASAIGAVTPVCGVELPLCASHRKPLLGLVHQLSG